MKKKVEKRGRPKVDKPKEVMLTIRLTESEARALKELTRDTKAKNTTIVIRNFISCGLWWLVLDGKCEPKNKVFYERFLRYWGLLDHLEHYSDYKSIGEQLTEAKTKGKPLIKISGPVKKS